MQDTALLIRNTLLEAIEATQDSWEPGGQRVSATGQCLRKNYYQITGAPRSHISAVGLEEMEDGNTHEDAVVARLRLAGYTITGAGETQEELTIDLPGGGLVTGHSDGRIVGPALYEPHLLEIKAMGAIRYSKFVKYGVAAEFPDYMFQVQLYMYASDLPGCVFIAKAKDSSATKMYLRGAEWAWANPKYHVEVIPYDPEVVMGGIERQSRLKTALDARVPPEREYKRSEWQCRYCDFSKHCWG